MKQMVNKLRVGIVTSYMMYTSNNDTFYMVPKGVQEKRTEVLENKVDRM